MTMLVTNSIMGLYNKCRTNYMSDASYICYEFTFSCCYKNTNPVTKPPEICFVYYKKDGKLEAFT